MTINIQDLHDSQKFCPDGARLIFQTLLLPTCSPLRLPVTPPRAPAQCSAYGALMMPGYQLHEGLGIEIPGNNIGRAYGTLFALGGEPWELAIDK